MRNYGIITGSKQLRNVTGSWWANADFSRIERIVYAVEHELATVIGNDTMEWLAAGNGSGKAWLHAACAVGYMACMRYYRLNDISHQDGGRKVKIDKENEARPFEWQLARDDRAHLEEYYRALDRLLYELRDCDQFKATPQYQAQQQLIIRDAITLTYLTGIDASAWLFLRLTPFLMESQRFVEKAYGQKFAPDDFQLMENTDTLKYAAQMAVALGALALMGRRTSLDTLPYGLMKVFEQDGGGNRREQAPLDRLNDYLKQLSKEQHYWLNEMRTLRDHEVDNECTYLQMPENHPNDKFMRL